ncbi:glycosyltransferase BC10 isoform X2 [Cucumis melo]|uniref:Glycosyltransferase BC10 isoform X2 n=1 Tax=Cucumis melo TaxID=3656 RepID=A0A1S3AZR5_CUCME|nr:glycosyltransferase BC10 isoform X2 [Cucumis melo]
MKKKALLTPPRRLFWFSWKLLVAFSLALCILALISLHSSPSTTDLAAASLSRRSRPPSDSFLGRPKIAFLFLTRRNLPLDFLWGSFFENGDVANFSIYIHSAPGFVFDESTTRSHFFFGRQLENSIQVAWGKSSMIAAERLLLEAALEDPANQRFVLLSDSFLDAKEGRYNPKMSPAIPKSKWRKGSQWISLIRSHAEVVVDDDIIFPIFGLFCKRRPPVDASKGNMNTKLQKQHNCIPDEHYVQTLLALNELEGELERRTVTYTLWNQSTTKMENKGWHPITFTYANAGPRQIKEIKGIDHVYYETEFRTEWCRNNSTFVPCFLFARKFSQGAAMRLLSEGVVSHFDASALLDKKID